MGVKRRRGRQEGSIYQRSDGRWTAAIQCGWKNGRRKRKHFYGETRKEVQDLLTKALRDQQLGLPVAVERQTVKEFLREWLEGTVATKVRPKTFSSYRQIIEQHIVPDLGHRELTKLSPQEVQHLLAAATKKGLSPRSVQYVRAVLRVALNRAVKWGVIVRNPAALVDPPRVVRPQVEPFTVEDIPKLLAAFEPERLGALYTLCMAHGLRQGEALALRWSDVDLDAATLRIVWNLQWREKRPEFMETKTLQSRRTIALSQHVVTALKRRRQAQLEERMKAGSVWRNEHDLIFTTRTGSPLDGANVTRDFQRMLKTAGLPIKRFHDLRHTAASLLLYQKVQPRVVMDVLGHTEIRTTLDLYSHVAPVMQRDAADQMDVLLAKIGSKN